MKTLVVPKTAFFAVFVKINIIYISMLRFAYN
jgi:hypothetical protein